MDLLRLFFQLLDKLVLFHSLELLFFGAGFAVKALLFLASALSSVKITVLSSLIGSIVIPTIGLLRTIASSFGILATSLFIIALVSLFEVHGGEVDWAVKLVRP